MSYGESHLGLHLFGDKEEAFRIIVTDVENAVFILFYIIRLTFPFVL